MSKVKLGAGAPNVRKYITRVSVDLGAGARHGHHGHTDVDDHAAAGASDEAP